MSADITTSSSTPIRTRFAPSPTGFLHLGGARTALYSWAYARHFGGTFVLRIEDTDVERSTPEAVQAILDAMDWLNLEYDEGPFYQMQRMERYREVVGQMLADGRAYHCYCQPAELDAMREAQRARGEKPRYDGRWRPEPGKALPEVPADTRPVVRFRNPVDGEVTWNDLVKGSITISNRELDDLIIARPDGTPTYNFCVCVDDWDMGITHVIRGDDHVNNTPRQINILHALGAQLPFYGHVPMILGPDGQKLSKRHGAVNVTQYRDEGILPEAMINYLARLGWSHGDDELFNRAQFVEWFDGTSLSGSGAQWDPAKLNWVNHQYIKQMDPEKLTTKLLEYAEIQNRAINETADLKFFVGLYKDRCETLEVLLQHVEKFNNAATPSELKTEHITNAIRPALMEFAAAASSIDWNHQSINTLIKEILSHHKLKMPQLAIPIRVLVVGNTQTPAIDKLLEIVGKEKVIELIEIGVK